MMRVFASAAGLVIAASLGGCAQGMGLPDIPMLSGGSFAEGSSAPVVTATLAPEDIPPLPERNPKKQQATASRAHTAANQAPAATGAKEKASDSGFSLAALTQMNPFSADTPFAPDSVLSSSSPIAAYTYLAQQIHACWLTPGAPKLPNHGFHADVSPKDANAAKIILYEKGPDKKRGVQVFRIVIGESGSGSVITSENRRLDTKLGAAFKADLARWAKGDNRCKG